MNELNIPIDHITSALLLLCLNRIVAIAISCSATPKRMMDGRIITSTGLPHQINHENTNWCASAQMTSQRGRADSTQISCFPI